MEGKLNKKLQSNWIIGTFLLCWDRIHWTLVPVLKNTMKWIIQFEGFNITRITLPLTILSSSTYDCNYKFSVFVQSFYSYISLPNEENIYISTNITINKHFLYQCWFKIYKILYINWCSEQEKHFWKIEKGDTFNMNSNFSTTCCWKI